MIDFLLWWLRLGAKLMIVIPGQTSALVILGLMSQVSMLASFLLPLKVIMMLGSGQELTQSIGMLPNIGHEGTVLFLSGLAVLLYLVFLTAGRLIERVADSGVRRILGQTSKVVLFENQGQVAGNAFKRYAGVVSRLMFALLAGLVIAMLYPEVAWFVSLAVGLLLIGGVLASHFSGSFNGYVGRAFPNLVSVLSGLIFLGVFGVVVSDFLWFSDPTFIVAIVALVLGRQLLSQISEALVGLRFLSNNRNRINVLFFSREVLRSPGVKLKASPVELLSRAKGEGWASRMISDYTSCTAVVKSAKWLQTGMPGILFVDVRVEGSDRPYLIKVFDSHRSSQALHEASLLLGGGETIPAPSLLTATTVEGFHVHLMDLRGLDSTPDGRLVDLKVQWQLALTVVEPEPEVVRRYVRSKPMLWDRLEPEMLSVLKIVAPDEIPLVNRFEDHLESVKARLRSLPQALNNPLSSLSVVREGANKQLCHLHWGQWSIEPVGAGWPCDDRGLSVLGECFEDLKKQRSRLRHVELNDVKLAAYMFEFERLVRNEKFLDAIMILRGADSLVEACSW